MTDPLAPTAQTPTAPPCGACGGPSVVHWLRRLTPEEVAEQQAREQARRDEALLLADTQLPPPEFGPLPDCADWTHAVYACIHHAITQAAAGRVHQADCTAPDPAVLPACNCTPEPAPAPDADPTPQPLPPGWT